MGKRKLRTEPVPLHSRGCSKCPLNLLKDAAWVPQVPDYVPEEVTAGGLLFVGEAPGEEEVEKMIPFVGRAGEVLRTGMRAAGIDENSPLANAVRCHPLLNRNPSPKEIFCCSVFLEETIRRVQPKVIVALGNVACSALLYRDGVSTMRGKIFRYQDEGIFVVPTWHPSYVSRAQHFAELVAGEFVSDLLLAKELLAKRVPVNPPVSVARSEEEALRALLGIGSEVAIDVEGSDQGNTVLMIGFSVCDPDYGAVVIPVAHPRSPLLFNGKFSPRVAARIVEILEDPKIAKVGHNFHGYDRPVLENFFGCKVRGEVWDSMYGSHLHDERRGIHDLDTVASRFIKMGGYDWKLVRHRLETMEVNDGVKRETREMYQTYMSNLDRVPLELLAEYNGLDAVVSHMVADKQRTHLTDAQVRIGKLLSFVAEAYQAMEQHGICFDKVYSRKLARQIEKRLGVLVNEIRLVAGDPALNVDSQPQMGKLLFEKLRLQSQVSRSVRASIAGGMRTGTGRWSTREEVINKLNAALKHPVLAALAEYRDLQKDLGTFVEGIQKIVEPDGRVHVPLLLHGTETGRASCRLHNVKKKESLLEQFVAEDGYVLIKADLSQIEMRVMAEMSRDPELLRIYRKGKDFHEETRQWIFGDKPGDGSEADMQRTIAKQCNFGTAYGLDADGLFEFLVNKIPGFSMNKWEVHRFHARYYRRFKRLRQWQLATIAFAHKHGYVEGLFGRRRHLEMSEGKHAENQAINSPIQGAAHDILLVIIAQMWEAIRAGSLKCRLLLEQHDAVIMEVLKRYVKSTLIEVERIIRNPDTFRWLGKRLTVPITAELKVGASLWRLGVSEVDSGSL